MPNFFQKFKQSITHTHSSSSTDEKKQNQSSNKTPSPVSNANNNQSKQNEQASHSNLVKKNSAEHNKKPDLQSIFSITIPHSDNTNINKNSKISNEQTNLPKKSTNEADPAQTSKSIFSLIIDSSFLSDGQNKGEVRNNENIFDPEPAVEETDTFNHHTYLDDRSFIVDDDELDNEITNINVPPKLPGYVKENNCYTINEVPEVGRTSKFNTSRSASRSSLGSESTRTSSNFLGDGKSDHSSSGLADMNKEKKMKRLDSHGESEGSASGSENVTKEGSKNVLLDALMRKFNINEETELATSAAAAVEDDSNIRDSSSKMSTLNKQLTKYTGEDQRKKQSELQRKINRNQIEKQHSINNQVLINKLNNLSEDAQKRAVGASSSFDDDPKEIKLVCSTGTQMTPQGSSVTKVTNFKQRTKQSSTVHQLPQNFECKYIGKTKCSGLWGIKNIREPVEKLVRQAKRFTKLSELPSVEALISEKGIYIVQKVKQNENENPTSSKNSKTIDGNQTLGKTYKSGLLPISNISYAVQDNVYGKIFSCIVVRDRDNKSISECYSFLSDRNETARRMALSITLAFKEYGKLLQLKETKINQTIKIQGTNEPEHDSFA